jgi:hypothetical protein
MWLIMAALTFVGPTWLLRAPARSLPVRMSEGGGVVINERCNVALTHTNADFDSLAGAVALAKLWSIERPELPTHVVMPRGVNPLVARFLACARLALNSRPKLARAPLVARP